MGIRGRGGSVGGSWGGVVGCAESFVWRGCGEWCGGGGAVSAWAFRGGRLGDRVVAFGLDTCVVGTFCVGGCCCVVSNIPTGGGITRLSAIPGPALGSNRPRLHGRANQVSWRVVRARRVQRRVWSVLIRAFRPTLRASERVGERERDLLIRDCSILGFHMFHKRWGVFQSL